VAHGLKPLFIDPVLGGWRPSYQLLLGKPQFNFPLGTLHGVAPMTDVPAHKCHSLDFPHESYDPEYCQLFFASDTLKMAFLPTS